MGSDIPQWITITLGAFAIAGPVVGGLLGAWLTARRDDKRDEAEKQRDRDKWQRETEREDVLYRRDRKRATYSSVINSWQELADDLQLVVLALERGEKDLVTDYRLNMAASGKTFVRALSDLAVDGSTDLTSTAADARDSVLQAMAHVNIGLSTADDAQMTAAAQEARQPLDAFRDRLTSFRIAVRGELGEGH